MHAAMPGPWAVAYTMRLLVANWSPIIRTGAAPALYESGWDVREVAKPNAGDIRFFSHEYLRWQHHSGWACGWVNLFILGALYCVLAALLLIAKATNLVPGETV